MASSRDFVSGGSRFLDQAELYRLYLQEREEVKKALQKQQSSLTPLPGRSLSETKRKREATNLKELAKFDSMWWRNITSPRQPRSIGSAGFRLAQAEFQAQAQTQTQQFQILKMLMQREFTDARQEQSQQFQVEMHELGRQEGAEKRGLDLAGKRLDIEKKLSEAEERGLPIEETRSFRKSLMLQQLGDVLQARGEKRRSDLGWQQTLKKTVLDQNIDALKQQDAFAKDLATQERGRQQYFQMRRFAKTPNDIYQGYQAAPYKYKPEKAWEATVLDLAHEGYRPLDAKGERISFDSEATEKQKFLLQSLAPIPFEDPEMARRLSQFENLEEYQGFLEDSISLKGLDATNPTIKNELDQMLRQGWLYYQTGRTGYPRAVEQQMQLPYWSPTYLPFPEEDEYY
jgi:hypothetical protein